MYAEGDIDPEFATVWLKLLRRPNVIEILHSPITIGRKIAKILSTLAADEYGELEFKWYEERKKLREFEKRLKEVQKQNHILKLFRALFQKKIVINQCSPILFTFDFPKQDEDNKEAELRAKDAEWYEEHKKVLDLHRRLKEVCMNLFLNKLLKIKISSNFVDLGNTSLYMFSG
jgi:hypothetical protein